MATLAQIRAAIVAKLEGVAGIGNVHDRERYADRHSELKTLFVTGGKVLGWVVRRVRTQEFSPAVGRYVVRHGWQIRGYMSFDDSASSETAFDDLIEDIRDAFRADEELGGLIAGIDVDDRTGVQVEDSGPVMFCGALCHGCRLALTTEHYQ